MITVAMITEVKSYTEIFSFQNPGGMGTIVPLWARELEKLGCRVAIDDPKVDWDILHLHSPLPASIYLAIRAKLRGKTIVTHGHHLPELIRGGFKGGTLFYPIFKRYSRYFYNLGDVVIVPSPYAEKVLRAMGVKRPMEIVFNGIDRDRFKKDPEAGTEFRRKWNLGDDDFIILSVGLRIPRKGVDTFLETAAEFNRRHPSSNVKFVWVGGSEPLLVDAMPGGALPDNVLFTGFVSFEQLLAAYSAADLFLFPTRAESYGNVIVEAASCNLPLVIREIPVFDEWLVDGSDCIKCRDAMEFVSAVELLWEDREMRARLSFASGRLAKSHDIEHTARRLFDIYSQLIGDIG